MKSSFHHIHQCFQYFHLNIINKPPRKKFSIKNYFGRIALYLTSFHLPHIYYNPHHTKHFLLLFYNFIPIYSVFNFIMECFIESNFVYCYFRNLGRLTKTFSYFHSYYFVFISFYFTLYNYLCIDVFRFSG